MQAGKHTAKEIVEAAGHENVDFGNVRINIGGVPGITKEDHVIRLHPGKVPVMVGDATLELEVSEGEADFVSEGARPVFERKGRKATEAAEELQAKKKTATDADAGDQGDSSDEQ